MKKTLLIFFLLDGIAPSLHAQNSGEGRSLTLMLGANNSRFSEDNNEDANCLLALFLGADYIFCPSGPLRFSTGMNW